MAIAKILDSKARVGGDAVQNLVYENACVIKNARHMMVLRWVSGHLEIPGNEKANVVAKYFRHKGRKKTNHWSSLIYIKAEL